MKNNIYGVQRVPEPEVRDKMDMALGATTMAAQGAKMGAQIGGPWGAAAGAVIGGGAGLLQQQSGQFKEQHNKSAAMSHNQFVNNLEGRDVRNTNLIRSQARYGMKARYQQGVEIEGDGSGDPINGIGEIHVDKNYNIKNMATGAKRHNEGGYQIPDNTENSLKKGDVVFPWQNDASKYEKGLSMIKRYKLNGDPRAKKWLDREKESLPTNEDYGYDQKYPEGVNYKTTLRRLLRKTPDSGLTREQIRNMSEEEAKSWYETQGYGGQNPTTLPSPDGAISPNEEQLPVEPITPDIQLSPNEEQLPTESENLADIGSGDSTMTGGQNITGQGRQEKEKNTKPTYRIVSDYDSDWDYRMDEKTGKVDVKRKNSTEWKEPSESWNKKNSNEPGTQTSMEITRQRVFGDWTPPETPPEKKAIAVDNAIEETNLDGIDTYRAPEQKLPPEVEEKVIEETGAPLAGDTIIQEDYVTERNNPLKRASIINNLIQGAEPVEQVNRRYLSPEELEYQDRSYSQRRAVGEQRNAANQMLRGKGLSIGQQQSYMGQTGARALRAHESINEREAQRADAVDAQNVSLRNQAKQTNLQLANQYDIQDSQNRAASRRYSDQAYADISTLAQIDEQRGYMMDKDRRAYDIQEKSIPLIGTRNFSYEKDNWGNLKYNQSASTLDPNEGRGKIKTTYNPDGTLNYAGKKYKSKRYNQIK